MTGSKPIKNTSHKPHKHHTLNSFAYTKYPTGVTYTLEPNRGTKLEYTLLQNVFPQVRSAAPRKHCRRDYRFANFTK